MKKQKQAAEAAIEDVGTVLYLLAFVIGCFCALGFGAIGLAKIGMAAWSMRGVFHDTHDPSGGALGAALKGLEFLFLAPLPVLVLQSVSNYWLAGLRGDSCERIQEHTVLVEVKILVVGLMAAAVATDLTGKVVSGKMLMYEAVSMECLVIGALCMILLILKKR